MSQYYLRKVEDQYYGVFKGNAEGKEIYVSVYVVFSKDDYIVPELNNNPITILDIIEGTAMESDKVQAKDLKEGLENSGSVSIYGIQFDHGKSEIKPESAESLQMIAEFLMSSPEIQVFIVGHTDNTGSLNNNMLLSQKRAEAVVEYLTTKLGAQTNQVLPKGVGPLAPKSSNKTEEGRSINRRVEIVMQ